MRDVTIIGAGPGGSTAAILLARSGWDVTLVEQSRFPRDKVCGECLSALGFEVLQRLGLAAAFRELGAMPLQRAELHAPSGRHSLRIDLPKTMWGLSRRAFDRLLLDGARDAGAIVRQPARCEALQPGGRGSCRAAARQEPRPPPDPGAALRLRDLISNRVEMLTPSFVILADGKAAFASDSPPPTGDLGIKAHFTNVNGPHDTIELFGVRGSYGGLAAIEGDRWNAAFSVPAVRVKACRGNLDALFQEIVSQNRTLARRLVGATRTGEWLASPLPRFRVRSFRAANVLPVGNAAAAVEPIGGEGMGLAMRSAELAAESLISGTNHQALSEDYARLWQTRRIGCRAAALATSNPRVSAALLRPDIPQVAVRAALRLIGKS